MNCPEVRRLLHPYSDGELDLVRHLEIEEHLAECSGCAEQEKHLRSLRAAVSVPSLYGNAPTSLASQVQFVAPAAIRRPRPSLPWAAIAAAVLLLIGISGAVGYYSSRTRASADDRLAEWVVAGHVRSLQADHLTDVPSSDRHTVKPWYRGKLDFSPQVLNLSPQGFELSGGRLDYLVDRQVAAIVYLRRQHVINLFTWPAANEEEKSVRRFARQGFHIRQWQRSGMTFWAISDLSEPELDEFVRLVQEQLAEAKS